MAVRFIDSMQFMNGSLNNLIESNKLATKNSFKLYDEMEKTFKYSFKYLN